MVYISDALLDLYPYYSLNKSSQAEPIEWSVKEISEDSYLPYLKFSYEVNGVTYEGEAQIEDRSLLNHRSYINRHAAEKAILSLSKQRRTVWFDSGNPSHYSLDKQFPWKKSVYASILLILLIYFVFLALFFKKNENPK